MANKYEEFIKEEWEKFTKEDKLLPNIMLLGATGCGKSSLINVVFQRNLAPVNDASRGTDGFKTYRGKDFGLGVNLIDSRGYEMEDGSGESFSAYIDAIKSQMERNRKKAPLEKIHIVWFCISIATGRIQEYDIEILKMLQRDPDLRGRVVVALTKCDEDDGEGSTAKKFKEILAKDVGRGLPAFEVSTDPKLMLELELEQLIDWSADQLDDADMKEAFIASQMISLKKKREAVAARIGFYSAAAAAIGASPIPFSDAALLVPLQIAMSADIIHQYGMENLANISKAVIGNVVVTNLGKAFAGGLLKLFPGLGTWAGGAINAGVALMITSALGFAISTICFECCKKIANGEEVNFDAMFALENIQSLVKQYLNTHKQSDVTIHETSDSKKYAEQYMSSYTGRKE